MNELLIANTLSQVTSGSYKSHLKRKNSCPETLSPHLKIKLIKVIYGFESVFT